MRVHFRWPEFVSLIVVVLMLSACGASGSAQASVAEAVHAPVSATPEPDPTESIAALEPEPTLAPDPELDGPVGLKDQPLPEVAPPQPVGHSTQSEALAKAQLRAEKEALGVPAGLVNGKPTISFAVMDQATITHIREIFAQGQALGHKAQAFSKAGDSTIESPYFLAGFDSGPYQLGDYAYLKEVIKYYQGSYGRKSLAVRVGQHSWTLMNPAWADKSQCNPDESPLSCELRQNNPSILLIRLGANDAGVPKLFEKNMRAVVEYVIAQGVIPVLSTKPDRRKGTEQNNEIVRQLAAEYMIPLWDFDQVAETLPDRGLGPDGVHMTGFYQNDYTLPQAFQRGQSLQNLTALIVLDELRQVLNTP